MLPGPRARPAAATSGRRGLGALAVLPVEALDPTGRVDESLCARIERMAVRAHLDLNLGECRARFERIAACAGYFAAAVFGMDSSFHWLIVGFLPIPPNITTKCLADNSPRREPAPPWDLAGGFTGFVGWPYRE